MSGYGPSVYYLKTKYFLDLGLQVNEIVVYVDISDVADEAVSYRFDANGNLHEGLNDPACPSPEGAGWNSPWWARWSYILDFAYKRHLLSQFERAFPKVDASLFMQSGGAYARDRSRASWTYDPGSPCYGTLGIEGGIAKEIAQMDTLYTLVSERGIALSVGVYPWPQQLLYDKEDYHQVTIWREMVSEKMPAVLQSFSGDVRIQVRTSRFPARLAHLGRCPL